MISIRDNKEVVDGLEILRKKVNTKREKLGLEGKATLEDIFNHQSSWLYWLYSEGDPD
jgi:hypothetical protein